MKKIMTALLCAVGFSLASQAEEEQVRINGTNFEALPVGTNVVDYADENVTSGGYWKGDGVDALIATNTFTAVEVQPEEGEPYTNYVQNIAPYSGAVGYPTIHYEAQTSNNFLSVNTKGGELVRNVDESKQSIGEKGIYFDSMVQFTATDALDANAGDPENDKLILWLRDNGDGTTNLVVNAGYLDKWGEPQSTNYVVTSNVQADKWYRLTIQAIEGVINNGDNIYVGYAIYIDGIKAEYSNAVKAFCTDEDVDAPYNVEPSYRYLYNSEVHALFPSLLGYTDKAKTFTAVAFSGVGAVDDIEFTTKAPDFIGPEKEWVAQIGSTKYETLAEAVEEAQANDTITLLKDTSVATWLRVAGKSITLDLNGFTVAADTENWDSGADAVIAIGRGGSLTVADTSLAGTGTVDSGTVMCAIKMTQSKALDNASTYNDGNKATFVLNGGTLKGYEYGISGNGLAGRGNTAVTINGGVVLATATRSLADPKRIPVGIYNPQENSTLTINGGHIEGDQGVYVKAGQVTCSVAAGTIVGTGDAGTYTNNGNGAEPTGAAFAIDSANYPGGVPGAEIAGGTFVSSNGVAVASYNRATTQAVTGFVAGGTFNTPVETGYCATGFIPADNGDGTYGVELGWKIAFVNDDDTLIYATNVQANATVEYLGETPTKAADAEYTYTFKGWTPALAAATADATYKATYDATPVATPTPTVDGKDVDAEKVFDNATSASAIVYPTEPTKTKNQDGTTTVTFNNKSSTVPAYYDVTITQTQEATTYTVTLKLNDTALPEIDEAVIEEDTKPAMEVTDDTTTVTLKATNPKLYYGLASADSANTPKDDYVVPATLTKGNGDAMQITIPVDSTETSKFYRVYVTDIAPAQSGN